MATRAVQATCSNANLLRADRRKPPVSGRGILLAAGTALAAAAVAGLASRRSAFRAPERNPAEACADRLRQGAGLLGASVLVDSAFEHFRGNYDNRLMYVPPLLAAATVTTGLGRTGPPGVQASVFGAAALVGTVGLGMHAYNIVKRPGGLSWNNLFYAAPFAAPGALALAGLLGFAAERLERKRSSAGGTARQGRVLAVGLAGGILATVAEVALLHFRGAYHNPAMYAPIVVPPLAAASLVAAGARPTRRSLALSRLMLRTTAALGAIGTALHAYGIQRNMGGWRHWTQNLFSGPPLPAPPSFTGIAIAALGALRLIKART